MKRIRRNKINNENELKERMNRNSEDYYLGLNPQTNKINHETQKNTNMNET